MFFRFRTYNINFMTKKSEKISIQNQTSTENSSRPYFLFKKAASCKCLLERIWIGWPSLSRQVMLKLESFNRKNFILIWCINYWLSYQNYPFPELLQRQAGTDYFTNLTRHSDLADKFVQCDETASILANTKINKLFISSRFLLQNINLKVS